MTTASLHECILRIGTSCEVASFSMSAFNAMLRKQRQEQKAERIAQRAEAAQRFAKRGNWK